MTAWAAQGHIPDCCELLDSLIECGEASIGLRVVDVDLSRDAERAVRDLQDALVLIHASGRCPGAY